MISFLTDFADQAVVLPLAGCVLALLILSGWRRGAASWALCVAGVLGVMLVLKLVMFACGWRIGWTDLRSPSGHTATAATVYGGLLVLLAPRHWTGTVIAALAGGAIAVLVGATRLALHVHTVSDVAVGTCVGVAWAMLLGRLAGPRPAWFKLSRLGAVVLVVVILFHGDRLEAESRIRGLALDIWPLTLCKK